MAVFFRSRPALYLLAAVFIICSLLVLDIRTGSGAFPHLKPHGRLDILSDTDGLRRCVLTRASAA